jgi:hypothetical protein
MTVKINVLKRKLEVLLAKLEDHDDDDEDDDDDDDDDGDAGGGGGLAYWTLFISHMYFGLSVKRFQSTVGS